MISQMLHPAVSCGTVPVFGAFRDLDDRARNKLHRRFAPFLIPAAAGHTNEDLHLFMMDMPVVPASGLETHIGNASAQLGQIAIPRKVLCISRIGLSLRPDREIYSLNGHVGISENCFKGDAKSLGFGKSHLLLQQSGQFTQFRIGHTHIPGSGNMRDQLGLTAGQG